MRVLHLTTRRSSWLLRSLIACAALSLFDFGLLRYWQTLLPQSPSFHIDLFVFHITINNTKHALKPYTSISKCQLNPSYTSSTPEDRSLVMRALGGAITSPRLGKPYISIFGSPYFVVSVNTSVLNGHNVGTLGDC